MTDGFAELVCSNSLRSDRMENAVGLLKAGDAAGSVRLVMRGSGRNESPCGRRARCRQKEIFSIYYGSDRGQSECGNYKTREVTDLEKLNGKTIVATGPLTSDALADYLQKLTG